MIELLNWRDKGFFGKKENISIHELADKGAEWGLFLSDSNTPLSAKTIEIELGEIWRGEHLQKVMDKKSKNKNINPEKPYVPLNKNDAFQKVQKRRVQKKR